MKLYITSFFLITLSYSIIGQSINYETEVQPIFNNSCMPCHGGSNPSGGVNLSSYDNVIASGVIEIGDYENSILWQEITSGDMPNNIANNNMGIPDLTDSEIEIIENWILDLQCTLILCEPGYECVLGECVCINDMDDDGICDELESECLEIEVLSINQINPDQFSVTVENNSSDNIFAYPGFILFNEFGDTIAIENVEYYGITPSSVHILDIQENVEITDYLSLELHTWYYDYLTCVWNDVIISDNCDLTPDPGFCLAAFDSYYFNPTSGECEFSLWGGCGGVVPFWTLEECQNSCQSILIPEIETNKTVIKKIDILGRDLLLDQGIIINLHNDGSVEKELILEE